MWRQLVDAEVGSFLAEEFGNHIAGVSRRDACWSIGPREGVGPGVVPVAGEVADDPSLVAANQRRPRSLTHGLAKPQINAKVKALGRETMSMSPMEFDTFLAEETANWAKVLKCFGDGELTATCRGGILGRTS
jgi:hypothetical protein